MLKNILNIAVVVSLAFATAFTSLTVQAADYTTEIGAASTEASANVSAATVAVIGLAVIGFGVAAVVAWMRK